MTSTDRPISEPVLRYELERWCHECKEGRHEPAYCTSGGHVLKDGRFPTIDAARRWVSEAAIDKRPPWRFAVRDLETGELIPLTGFRISDWD